MKPSDLMKHAAFPTFAAVARVCGVSREAVRRWKSIPPVHCIAIEQHTRGALSRYRLRPDVFGKQIDHDNANPRQRVKSREVEGAKKQRNGRG